LVLPGSPLDWVDEDRTRYCLPRKLWFVTPVDPNYVANGSYDNDRQWTAEDVIVIDTLEEPCFDRYDTYTITRDQ